MQSSQHHFSPAEVSEAFELRQRGHQQLCDNISTTEISLFDFNLQLSGCRTAVVRIEVQPVQYNDSHHPFYAIRILYEDSHPHQPVDDDLITKVQIVYDTYIQASRWKFDTECFKRCPELCPCDACRTVPASVLETASLAPRSSTAVYLPTPEFEERPVRQVSDTRLVLSTSNNEGVVTYDGDAAETAVVPRSGVKRAAESMENNTTGRATTKRKRQTVDEIIDNLVDAILDGLKNRATKILPATGLDKLANSILTQCKATATSQELDTLLLKLAGDFAKNMRLVKKEAVIIAWFNWYFSSCLHYLRHQMKAGKRDRRQDRPSLRIGMIHAIVNPLLFTDGINALSVIAALAGMQVPSPSGAMSANFLARGHTLSAAARFSTGQRQLIGRTVAERIKGKLQEPNDFVIPNPMRYAAVILQKEKEFTDLNTTCHGGDSFSQACQNLGLPNLAVLQSQTSAMKDQFLVATIRISDVRAHWASFENAVPRVKAYRRLLILMEEFKVSAESPLSQLEGIVTSLESGHVEQALATLDHPRQARSGSDLPNRPGSSANTTHLVRKASSLLLSRFSYCVHDWLELSGPEQDSISNDSIEAGCPEPALAWQEHDDNATFAGYNSTDVWDNGEQIYDFDQLLNIDWPGS